MERTVTRLTPYRPDFEMSLLGYLIGAILVVVVVPLLPIIVLLVAVDWIVRRVLGGRGVTRYVPGSERRRPGRAY